MFVLCILSLVIADRVKIASRDSPDYILTLIKNVKGGSIRMMKESDVDNPTEQSGFELTGDKTELNNHGVIVCGNIWGSGISTCARESSKKTVFNVIKTNTDVTFKTDGGKCLTMEDYDLDTRGYYLRLNNCDDSPSQKFKLVDMPKTDQTKTPLAPLPNDSNADSQKNVNDACSNVNMSNKSPGSILNTADGNSQNTIADPCSNVNMARATSAPNSNSANGNSQKSITNPCSKNVNTAKATSAPNSNTANGNSQNTIADPCSTVNMAKATSAQIPNTANCNSQNTFSDPCTNETMPNIVFIPVSFEPNSIPFLTEGSQFGNNITPFSFDANRSKTPTPFNSVYKFRRPAQPGGNESNNHLQWTGLFRRYY